VSPRRRRPRLAPGAWLLFALLGAGRASAFEPLCSLPLVAGNSWTYGSNGSTAVTTVLPDRESIDGELAWPLETTGTDSGVEYLTNDPEGLRYHGLLVPAGYLDALVVFDPPLLVSPVSTAIPSTYKSSGSALFQLPGLPDQMLSYRATAKLLRTESVTVPAGTFDALRLQLAFSVSGSVQGKSLSLKSNSTLWLAEDVGKVKEAGSAFGQSFGDELVSYDVAYDGLPCPEPARGAAAASGVLALAALAASPRRRDRTDREPRPPVRSRYHRLGRSNR